MAHACLFLLYGCVMAGLATRIDPAHMNFPTVLVTYRSKTNSKAIELALRPTPSVPVPVIMVIVLFLESLTAMLILLLGKSYYENHISEGRNPVRWISFSVTASLQRLCVCLYSGLADIPSILAVVMITALVNVSGIYLDASRSLRAFFLVSLLYGLSLIMLGISFIGSAVSVENLPDFIPAVFVVNELVFASFAFVMLYSIISRRRRGTSSLYSSNDTDGTSDPSLSTEAQRVAVALRVEFAYAILSIAAKLIIASIIVARPLQKVD